MLDLRKRYNINITANEVNQKNGKQIYGRY